MQSIKKHAFLLYIIGFVFIIWGLFYYNYVNISDNIFGMISSFMIQSRSVTTMYIGLGIIGVGFLLTQDFIKVYAGVKLSVKKYPKATIGLIISLLLFGISSLLPVVIFTSIVYVLGIALSIYFIIKISWIFVLSLGIVLMSAYDFVEFLFFFNAVSTEPNYVITIISISVMLTFLVLTVLIIIDVIKNNVRSERMQLWMFSSALIFLIWIQSLGFSRAYYSGAQSSTLVKTDFYLMSLILQVVVISSLCYMVFIKKLWTKKTT